MIVSINQPAYLPWIGYFHRIAVSDLHIILDHVQFEKNSFINRNKIKTNDGWCWLTVPVKTKGKFQNLPINSLEIDNNNNWKKKHWQTICQYYSKATYFEEHKLFFEDVYKREWQYLGELCYEITNYVLKVLNINTKLIFSSEMHSEGVKDELVLNLCKQTGATTYLSGILGKNYIKENLFTQQGIKITYQNYQHPIYPQYQEGGFEPYMSIIDLLFNCGEESLNILMAQQDVIQV